MVGRARFELASLFGLIGFKPRASAGCATVRCWCEAPESNREAPNFEIGRYAHSRQLRMRGAFVQPRFARDGIPATPGPPLSVASFGLTALSRDSNPEHLVSETSASANCARPGAAGDAGQPKAGPERGEGCAKRTKAWSGADPRPRTGKPLLLRQGGMPIPFRSAKWCPERDSNPQKHAPQACTYANSVIWAKLVVSGDGLEPPTRCL